MAQVMFKTGIKGNLDETDIIDAICQQIFSQVCTTLNCIFKFHLQLCKWN